tara:strand:+ start:590 stop:1855 length:1266 start_codon:yes stop_codon:yes gene_type:complete
MMNKVTDYNNLEEWFCKVANNEIKPSLVHLIGDVGVGKKTDVRNIIQEYGYRCININCIYDKDHSRFKKKTFVNELSHIVTNRNIEYYLTGKKDVVVIHNLHVITEKAFYDDMLKLNSDVEFVTPVICILNKNYISERFLSYMTKNCIVFNYPKKSQEELESILKEYGKQYGLKTIPNELINETFDSKGNIYALMRKCREYALTKCLSKNIYNSCKIDKNIVTKCFNDLCNQNESWTRKQDIIKSQGSLIRLLMPSHVFAGLDQDETKDLKESHEIASMCMKNLAAGELLSGTNNTIYASLLQCIYPTFKVQNTTIKSMVLSNCQSTSNMCVLPRLLYPHPEEQYIYILYYIIEAIELEQARKKIKDETEWNTWLPCLSKIGLNELQQKYLKIFSKYTISKKKVNRFLLRLHGAIPDVNTV